MASGQTVLREYLLALGFKIDSAGQRKFDSLLSGTAKSAGAAGIAVGGLGATILALAQQYASAMEKMYYASRRADSTVGQMQSLEFAGKQVGLAAGQMTSSVTAMASALRNNPGLTGLLNQLGVQTKGRTPAQELMDLVDKTASMPYAQGSKIAGLFGLDEGTYQVLRQNREEVRKAMEEQERINKNIGADVDANAKAMAEWGKQVNEVKAVFEALKGMIATGLLPQARELATVTKEVLGDWSRIINDKTDKRPLAKRIDEDLPVALGMDHREGVKLADQGGGWFDRMRRAMVDKVYGPGGADKRLGPGPKQYSAAELAALDKDFKSGGGRAPAAPAGSESAGHGFGSQAERFAALEKMWGLTPGTLQTLRNLESADGKNMGTGKRNALGLGGIVGDFQMNSANRKAYGVVDPSDEADAAAEMFADLKKRYGSDAAAAAAWNGGHAAGRFGAGSAVNPAETGPFVERFMSGINQTNHITVQGGGAGVVGAVKQGLGQANGDLVRNMKTVVQ